MAAHMAQLLSAELEKHRRSRGKRTADPLLGRKYPTHVLQPGRVLKLGVDHPPLRDPLKIGCEFGDHGPKLIGTP